MGDGCVGVLEMMMGEDEIRVRVMIRLEGDYIKESWGMGFGLWP